ncbi:hypothetical protein ACJX0J_018804, partial [Zea mays]
KQKELARNITSDDANHIIYALVEMIIFNISVEGVTCFYACPISLKILNFLKRCTSIIHISLGWLYIYLAGKGRIFFLFFFFLSGKQEGGGA